MLHCIRALLPKQQKITLKNKGKRQNEYEQSKFHFQFSISIIDLILQILFSLSAIRFRLLSKITQPFRFHLFFIRISRFCFQFQILLNFSNPFTWLCDEYTCHGTWFELEAVLSQVGHRKSIPFSLWKNWVQLQCSSSLGFYLGLWFIHKVKGNWGLPSCSMARWYGILGLLLLKLFAFNACTTSLLVCSSPFLLELVYLGWALCISSILLHSLLLPLLVGVSLLHFSSPQLQGKISHTLIPIST